MWLLLGTWLCLVFWGQSLNFRTYRNWEDVMFELYRLGWMQTPTWLLPWCFFLFQNVLPNMFVAIQGYEVAKKYCLLWYFRVNIRFSKRFASNPFCKGGGSARYNPQVHTRCKQEIHGENIEVTSPYLQMFIGSSSRTQLCLVESFWSLWCIQ